MRIADEKKKKTEERDEREMGKCVCGKTKDPNGNCDGSHANVDENVKDTYGKRNDTEERVQRPEL